MKLESVIRPMMLQDAGDDNMDLFRAMEELSKERLLLRNEKDFAVNLGGVLTRLYPTAEKIQYDASGFYRGSERVDLLTAHGGTSTGIELKYKPVSIGNTEPFLFRGTEFWLPRSGQPDDLTRFKFLEDIERLETVTANRADIVGYAILLTNKQGLWTPPRKERPNDLMFRIHEGLGPIHGRMEWMGEPAKSTRQMTGDSVTLRGKYPIKWRDFMVLPDVRNGLFRYVAVRVG